MKRKSMIVLNECALLKLTQLSFRISYRCKICAATSCHLMRCSEKSFRGFAWLRVCLLIILQEGAASVFMAGNLLFDLIWRDFKSDDLTFAPIQRGRHIHWANFGLITPWRVICVQVSSTTAYRELTLALIFLTHWKCCHYQQYLEKEIVILSHSSTCIWIRTFDLSKDLPQFELRIDNLVVVSKLLVYGTERLNVRLSAIIWSVNPDMMKMLVAANATNQNEMWKWT